MASADRGGGGAAPAGFLLPAAGIVLGAAAMFALNTGGREHGVHDAVRYAQMVMEMTRADTMVPTFDGRPYHEAMPVAAWAPLAVARLQGGLTPATSRVMPALAAVALVVAVLLLVRRHGGTREALVAGAFVALNALVIVYARSSRVDTLLALAIVVAVGAFFEGAVSGRPRWFLLSGAGLALALAAKGPMAAVLAAAVVIPWCAWERRWGALVRGTGVALLAAVPLTAAWLLPYLHHLGPGGRGAFFEQMILRETVEKAETGYGKAAPPWEYLVQVVTHFGPWVLAAAAGLWCVWRDRARARPIDRLAACWTAVPFLLLSLASGKNARYLLPLLPAMAILAAPVFLRWTEAAGTRAPRATRSALSALALLVAAAAVAAPFLPQSRGAPVLYAWGAALGAAAAAAAALAAAARGRILGSLLGLFAGLSCLVAFFYGAALASPAARARLDIVRFADAVAEVVPPDAPLAIAAPEPRRERGEMDRYEVALYLGRWVENGLDRPDPRGYLVTLEPPPGRPVLRTLEWRRGAPPWHLVGPAPEGKR